LTGRPWPDLPELSQADRRRRSCTCWLLRRGRSARYAVTGTRAVPVGLVRRARPGSHVQLSATRRRRFLRVIAEDRIVL